MLIGYCPEVVSPAVCSVAFKRPPGSRKGSAHFLETHSVLCDKMAIFCRLLSALKSRDPSCLPGSLWGGHIRVPPTSLKPDPPVPCPPGCLCLQFCQLSPGNQRSVRRRNAFYPPSCSPRAELAVWGKITKPRKKQNKTQNKERKEEKELPSLELLLCWAL